MINNFLSKGMFYCIYDDCGDSSFRVGYLVFMDDTDAVFNLFTTRGYEDGFYLTPIDNIYRVVYEDHYSNRILKLMKINEQRKVEIQLDDQPSLAQSLLHYSKKHFWYVTIELDNEDQFTGEIVDVNDDTTTIRIVDEDGAEDGLSVLRNDSIVRLWSNTGKERNVQALRNL